jgi:acetyl esterase/lipase
MRVVVRLGLAVVLCAPRVAAQRDTSANVLAISRPGMTAVRVERGIVYRDTLTLDVYHPGSGAPGTARPAIVFVPGGLVAGASGASPTTWPFYRSWGRLAAASGFVGITVNHRLTTNDNVVEAESDVREALRHLRANAARLGIDRERVCVAFYSAGGEIAAAALHEPPPWLRCVLLFYPFLDLEHKRVRSPFRDPQPAAHVDSLVPRYSPAALLAADPARLPPIFLAVAGRDAIPGIHASVEHFVSAALAHRAPLTMMVHPTGAHGFDQRDHDARTVEIMEAALAFVSRHTR